MISLMPKHYALYDESTSEFLQSAMLLDDVAEASNMVLRAATSELRWIVNPEANY